MGDQEPCSHRKVWVTFFEFIVINYYYYYYYYYCLFIYLITVQSIQF